MQQDQLLTYSFVVLLLTLTPGTDTALVLRNVFSSGKWSGLITTLGITTGLLVYALISALGISFIFTKSDVLYNLLKTLGAFYLMYLGSQSVLPLIKGKLNQNKIKFLSVKKISNIQAYSQGFISNILNPKIVVFYLTFLPQFIAPQDHIVIKSFFLTGIHIVMGSIWLSFLSFFIGSVRYLYSSPKLQRALEVFSGFVMILLGIILLFENK